MIGHRGPVWLAWCTCCGLPYAHVRYRQRRCDTCTTGRCCHLTGVPR